MAFNVHYFDGKSSKMRTASLSTNSLSWKISFENKQNVTETISWNIAKIKKTDVHTDGIVTFTYGDRFPFQRIESTDASFINYIKNSQHKNLTNKVDILLQTSKKSTLFYLLVTIVGIAIGVYFYVIPAVASNFAKNLSKENVISFGNYVFNILSSDLEIDDQKSQKLQSFVDEIEIDATFPIEVYVVKSEDFNAFAISGGKIVVFSSLLDKIQNESQLLALLGHEISHIENRHVLKNVSRNLSGAIFMSILFGDINGIATIFAENAHLFSQLSYTRKLETEADLFGLEIMKKNQVDLSGMPALFEILKDETKIDVPTYLSNHPMLKDRIEYTQKIAKEQSIIPENKILKKRWVAIKATFNNMNKDE